MSDEMTEQLQHNDEWDFSSAVRQRSDRKRRAVVSVAFASAEFAAVSEAARKHDVPLSRFIRDAALDRVSGRSRHSLAGSDAIYIAGSLSVNVTPDALRTLPRPRAVA